MTKELWMRPGGLVAYTREDVEDLVETGEARWEEFISITELPVVLQERYRSPRR